MDHVVLLARHHPGLRDHQAVAVSERAVDRMGIAAVLELPLGEPQCRGERAGRIERAVAVGADAGIDRLAALEGRPRPLGLPPVAEEGRVVDVGLVGRGRLRRQHGRIGGQGGRPLRAAGGHLGEIADEIEELPPVGEQVGEAGRHQRLRRRYALVDRGLRDGRLAAAGRGIPEHQRVGRLAGDEARAAQAVVGDERDTAVLRPDHSRRVENRLDEMGDEPLAWHVRRHGGEVGAERRGARAGNVALHAGEVPGVKDRGAAGGIAEPLDVGHEGRGILGRKRRGQARGHRFLGGRH
jgi:hypothetical protein